MLSEGWIQFLFVAVPVLSLLGTWMGLRKAGQLVKRRERERQEAAVDGTTEAQRQEAGKGGRSDSTVE